jgi:hypothetical protein
MSRLQALSDRYRVLKARLKKLYAVYGLAAVVTWFSLFFLVLAAFVIAIEYGSDAAGGGKWLAAYVATEATKPIRIVATLVLTPFVAQAGRRIRGVKATPDQNPDTTV